MRDQRRRYVNILLEPALQLKLPLILFAMMLIFAALQIWHSYYAYNQLFVNVFREAGRPEFLANLIEQQTRGFLKVSAVVGLFYLLLVSVVTVAYAHRMVGPITAFRRHIEALNSGDYRSRVQLRKGDAFSSFAGDLNELAQALEERHDKDDANIPAA